MEAELASLVDGGKVVTGPYFVMSIVPLQFLLVDALNLPYFILYHFFPLQILIRQRIVQKPIGYDQLLFPLITGQRGQLNKNLIFLRKRGILLLAGFLSEHVSRRLIELWLRATLSLMRLYRVLLEQDFDVFVILFRIK